MSQHQPLSVHDLRGSKMNPLQGKDTALAYLKVVIHLLNENMDELDISLGRPLRMEDLDHLTSHQMLNIVTFLLKEVVGPKPVFKSAPLEQFNKYGIGHVTYDCGIDQIYHAVKQIFPEDSDLFHYSVLLLPADNPKRTKAVISYIMSFVLMCDKLDEQFHDCFNQVIQENEEKGSICRSIDDLKDKIAEKIQQKEVEKERLPLLQKELQVVQDHIRKQQNVLAKLNAELEKVRTKYESKDMQTRNLEQELSRVETERIILEQHIVANPKEIESENESVKKQFESETKTREVTGKELEKYSKGCDDFDSLTQRAKHVLQGIEGVTNLMEDTKMKLETYTKAGNEINSCKGKLELRKQELKKLADQHANKLAEVNKLKEDMEFRREELANEIPCIQDQIAKTQEQVKFESDQYEQLRTSLAEVEKDIKEQKKRIIVCVQKIDELNQLKSDRESEASQLIHQMKENLCFYPMLDMSKDDEKENEGGS